MKKEQKNYRNWIMYLLLITLVISVINFVQISSITNKVGQPTAAIAADGSGTVNPQPSAPTAVTPPKPVDVSADDDPAKGDPALAE